MARAWSSRWQCPQICTLLWADRAVETILTGLADDDNRSNRHAIMNSEEQKASLRASRPANGSSINEIKRAAPLGNRQPPCATLKTVPCSIVLRLWSIPFVLLMPYIRKNVKQNRIKPARLLCCRQKDKAHSKARGHKIFSFLHRLSSVYFFCHRRSLP